jgi:hypothetical protein
MLYANNATQTIFFQRQGMPTRPLFSFSDMPRNTTIEEKGTSSIPVSTSATKVLWCTVMLSITADGRKLLPYVIFKRKTMPKGILPSCICVKKPEEKMDVLELMKDWFHVV